jgi:hypothetical protein
MYTREGEGSRRRGMEKEEDLAAEAWRRGIPSE